jgi:hypothetical protein
MTSIASSFSQINSSTSHFVALANLSNAVFTPVSLTAVVADATDPLVVAAWADSLLTGAGDLLKDLGKTVIAKDVDGNPVTFRLVQYVDPASPATNGITGPTDAVTGASFNTGYIMLGLNGAADANFTNAVVAKVAKYGV